MSWSRSWVCCKFCGKQLWVLAGRSWMPNRLYGVSHSCMAEHGGCGALLEAFEKDDGSRVSSADNWFDPKTGKWDYVFGGQAESQ